MTGRPLTGTKEPRKRRAAAWRTAATTSLGPGPTRAALLRYRRLPAETDCWEFDIVVDAHEGADPGKSGDLLRDTI